MNDIAIQVENLSKSYRIGKSPAKEKMNRRLIKKLYSPFEYLISSLRAPDEDELIWALRDVSFEVNRGEVLGIIGKNGAGKSTLLKVLSRITEPTSGRAVINGRVGSLLEVGTGFHPELTGRENIYLSGAVLGMQRSEIDRKFDEIVAFAETGRFLDTPVKRYSSGMYVRLAFAVAAHLEPEVLVVDEVLAVGDAEFQKKCLGKMGDVATQGRTVLFVSHNMVAIQNLCQRVLLLKSGEIVDEGETAHVISKYLQTSFSNLTEQNWDDSSDAAGNDKIRLKKIKISPIQSQSAESPTITMETDLEVEIEYWNLIPETMLHTCLHVYNEQQIVAFTTASIETDLDAQGRSYPSGLIRSVCRIPGNLLNSGKHSITLLILRNTSKIIFRLDEALVFDVIDMSDRPGTWYGKEPGAVRPMLDWSTEFINTSESIGLLK